MSPSATPLSSALRFCPPPPLRALDLPLRTPVPARPGCGCWAAREERKPFLEMSLAAGGGKCCPPPPPPHHPSQAAASAKCRSLLRESLCPWVAAGPRRQSGTAWPRVSVGIRRRTEVRGGHHRSHPMYREGTAETPGTPPRWQASGARGGTRSRGTLPLPRWALARSAHRRCAPCPAGSVRTAPGLGACSCGCGAGTAVAVRVQLVRSVVWGAGITFTPVS